VGCVETGYSLTQIACHVPCNNEGPFLFELEATEVQMQLQEGPSVHMMQRFQLTLPLYMPTAQGTYAAPQAAGCPGL
jgi:hypothetical protein